MDRLERREQPKKVVIVGDCATGKSTFIKRAVYGYFTAPYRHTYSIDIGVMDMTVDRSQRESRVDDVGEVAHPLSPLPHGKRTDADVAGGGESGGKGAKTREEEDPSLMFPQTILHIWDVPGEYQDAVKLRSCYHGVTGALVLCDRTQPETLESALRWKRGMPASIPAVLCVNKSDLDAHPAFHYRKDRLDRVVKEEGFIGWLPTSAKTGENVYASIRMVINFEGTVPSSSSSRHEATKTVGFVGDVVSGGAKGDGIGSGDSSGVGSDGRPFRPPVLRQRSSSRMSRHHRVRSVNPTERTALLQTKGEINSSKESDSTAKGKQKKKGCRCSIL
eukprot:TRINITY_DN1229_c0_g1_i1.p1 TRINITY_DN1229_c0_g1~~TRINITY_DN1229_c0_g1_i1.p1  ORF type:complete len:333 (-),score=91.08 TRINITY_DN1229_c0_g1_i1:288-1286(-)